MIRWSTEKERGISHASFSRSHPRIHGSEPDQLGFSMSALPTSGKYSNTWIRKNLHGKSRVLRRQLLSTLSIFHNPSMTHFKLWSHVPMVQLRCRCLKRESVALCRVYLRS